MTARTEPRRPTAKKTGTAQCAVPAVPIHH